MNLSLLALSRAELFIPQPKSHSLWLAKHILSLVIGLLWFIQTAVPASAQPLIKTVTDVGPGNTILTGATFAYRLTYTCGSTSGPCLNAQVVDLLPPEVQYVSSVPASPTGDVAAINVTSNYMGSGRTRVQFVLINPLPAGNAGDLLINARFPNGSTPSGTVAANTADGINLGSAPGTFTTPPVSVTGQYTDPITPPTLALNLTTAPANLDMPETYRFRFSAPSGNGVGNYTAVGPVTITLPPGAVFNGATPAADCQPGCVGTTPATITFTSPFALPVTPGSTRDIFVNLTFPSATFPSGTNLTVHASAAATQLGRSSETFSTSLTHSVTTFVPSPSAGLGLNLAGGTPNPPTLNQTFSYDLNPGNNGNVPLDNLVVISTNAVELAVASVSTGAYTNVADFAAGEGVRVSYEKNTAPSVFTLWGSSPNVTTNTTLTAPPPGLGAGEYITRIRWAYGQAQVGMSASTRPLITGRIINPDNAGGPVSFGNTIQTCAALTAVYTAGPTNVSQNVCRTFTLSGPFVQFNPASENLSGGGPFNPGQTVSWRTRVRSASQSSDPAPLENVVAVALLDERLTFTSWVFDDRGTGIPAPQNFTATSGVVIDGKTYTQLRWRWNAGSGNLGINQEVWINVSTTVKNLPSGSTVQVRHLLHYTGNGLAQRCSGSSQSDPADLDSDGNLNETYCYSDGTANIACLPLSVNLSSGTAVCAGSSVTIAAQTSGTVFSFEWYKDGVSLGATSQNRPLSFTNVQAADAGNYQLVVSGSCTSLTSTAFNLVVNPLPVNPSLTSNGTLTCANTSVTLTASGGTTYQFSSGATPLGGSSANTATVSQPGLYSVTVLTANGCSAIQSMTVQSNTVTPIASLTNNGPLSAMMASVTLTAGGGSTYSFSSGAIQQGNSNLAIVAMKGIYSVTVTAPNGCTATAQTTVNDNTSPTSQTICRAGTAVITVFASGSGFQYQWYKNGQTAANKMTEIASIQKGTATSSLTLVNVQTGGNYYLKVTNGSGVISWYGPFQISVNANCNNRLAAEAEPANSTLQIILTLNPLLDNRLRAVVKGAGGRSLTVHLTDLRGQLLRQQQWESAAEEQSLEWELSSQSTGMYLLKAQTVGAGVMQSQTIKLIKP